MCEVLCTDYASVLYLKHSDRVNDVSTVAYLSFAVSSFARRYICHRSGNYELCAQSLHLTCSCGHIKGSFFRVSSFLFKSERTFFGCIYKSETVHLVDTLDY